MKTAIVIGATGMVGKELVSQLLKDTRFDRVKVFVRRSTGLTHNKLEEHVVSFDEPDTWKKTLTGDVLYSAMGTTLKAAGSKDAQYKIDYTYQHQTAKIAAANNVREYILVSAAGSAPDSGIFYSRIKGELERDVKKLPFEVIHIMRPGMLTGHRNSARPGERLAGGIIGLLSHIPGLSRFKPVKASELANAMITATFRQVLGIHTYTLGEVAKLVR